MLDQLFLRVLDMSKIASIVILAVLLARLCLRRAPKIVSYALWAVVLFRLLCPLSIQAPVSLVPALTPTAQTYRLADEPISAASAGFAAYQAVGDALNGGLGVQHIPTTETDDTGAVRYVTSDWRDICILCGQYIWMAGIAVMLLHSAISYGKIRRMLKITVPLRDTVFLADDISSPFVMGLLHPKIYLPCGLNQQEQEYIICHEQHHIKRLDHVYKALAYLALCVHWFNPLVWMAFVLAGKDMEMSCDEAVVRELGGAIRADYSACLLSMATGRRIIAGTPLAFGEGNAKDRIRNLGKWKRPALWAMAVAAVAVLVLIVCLATDPTDDIKNLRRIDGLVTALQTGEDGKLTALVIQTDTGKETGILITEDTTAFPPGGGGGTTEELRTVFQSAVRQNLLILANCTRSKKTLTTDSGAKIAAYEARYLRITGEWNRDAAALADGTRLGVVKEGYPVSRRTYLLEDGTELLRVNAPSGPNDVHVGGVENFGVLNETAQKQILAYYGMRGLLYDEQAELEKAYGLFRYREDFRCCMVEQCVSPCAASSRVMYFLTSVTQIAGSEFPYDVYEKRLCDAFDRETGEHIDTWNLFTVPEEDVKKALLDACGLTEQPLRREMESASWDGRVEFTSSGLSVMFEPGAIPGERSSTGFSTDYTPAVLALMQDWAVPQGRD